MSDPIIAPYGGAFIYYTCDRNPTSSEPLVYNNIPDLLLFWWNTVTDSLFWCTDNTSNAMVWQQDITLTNLPAILTSLGFYPSVARTRTQRSTPEFSTSYRPSTTSDIEVNITLNFTALVSLNSQVNIQTSPDNSVWTTLFPVVRVLALATNFNDAFTFTVPIGSYYRIVQQTGTASSIVSIYELTV